MSETSVRLVFKTMKVLADIVWYCTLIVTAWIMVFPLFHFIDAGEFIFPVVRYPYDSVIQHVLDIAVVIMAFAFVISIVFNVKRLSVSYTHLRAHET